MTQEESRIRTLAGYLLKNNSRLILGASPEVAAYVKASILQSFNDSSVMIRNAAGQNIVAFLGVLEPKNWPECLQELVNTLDSTDLDRQEVSRSCLYSSYFGVVNISGIALCTHPLMPYGKIGFQPCSQV